ncbi:sarcosine oxidase subunit gamma family protein [Rhodovarius crocodyli]|uniref:sarcosine oxidase subunit gamma family protein n=1 Tax=Rhodovarius crocodyli TaxID=1979269 RepID=UPI0013E40AC4|nr:sarcosine oxidase subunit gamma family protein [Rhodovarius crocodyli]
MVELIPLPPAPLTTLWGDAPGPELGHAVFTARGALLRLAPREWLAIGPGDWPGLEAVDVSGASTGWRLRGPDARALLSRGAAIDLDARHFPAGHCARTRVARCPAILLARGEGEIDLLAARSYAPWLQGWLLDAAGVAGLA